MFTEDARTLYTVCSNNFRIFLTPFLEVSFLYATAAGMGVKSLQYTAKGGGLDRESDRSHHITIGILTFFLL